jgi:hypothetical protein
MSSHITHCCFEHGCKYSDDDCPVETGAKRQEHPCEQCDEPEPGQVRRIVVQVTNRKGEWQTAVLQTPLGRHGIIRNTPLDFTEGEVESPYYEAYQGGCAYRKANPDAELRVIEIVETPMLHLTALVLN